MPLDSEQLKKSLIDSELLTKEQVESADQMAKNEDISLTEALLEQDLISDEHLGEIIADLYNVPFVILKRKSLPDDVLAIIPELVAKKQKIIAFERGRDGLKLAMNNPEDLEIIRLISKKTGDKIIPYYATERDIKEAIIHYRKGLKEEFNEIIKENASQAKEAKAEDLPIIKIVSTIMDYAYQNKASDIHIEPLENKMVVRFRIDGVLHDVISLDKNLHEPIVSRVKILSKLRTDEHRSAQDGKFRFNFEDEDADVRVSIVPISDGEKVVMRLLSEKSRQHSLEDLGLAPVDLNKVKKNFKKPYGMILSTGPTGSGKTTTLYAILKILNDRKVNISTIEDPVEYEIEGVNQIQVNPQTNLTFAKGLRAILRQDPDIIMVGEIRDEETADIAINSAMTGHLVLSTLHTNDAPTTLPRLLDMSVEPFLIASTVNVAIGQRLVRRIHQGCMESYAPSSEEINNLKKLLGEKEIKKLGLDKNIRLYRGRGCDICNHTGYEGRIGIFEVLEVDEKIRDLIMKRVNSDVIKAQAIQNGMTTMFQDGAQKALKGITTIEEVLRVAIE